MTLLNNKHKLPIFDYFMLDHPKEVIVINSRNFIIHETNVIKLFGTSPNKLLFLKHKRFDNIKEIEVYNTNLINVKCKDNNQILKVKNGDFINYDSTDILKDKKKVILKLKGNDDITVNYKKVNKDPEDKLYKVIVQFKDKSLHAIPTLSKDFEDNESLKQLSFS